MDAKYVRIESGDYLLQIESETLFPRWGFALCDAEQSWEGGVGIANKWTVVPASEVPADVRERFAHVIQSFEEE
jgi:hypothetical protein